MIWSFVNISRRGNLLNVSFQRNYMELYQKKWAFFRMWKFKLFLHLSSISHHKTSLNVLMYPTSSSISSRMYLKLTTNGRTDIEVGLQKRFWHLFLGWLGSTCSSLQTVLSKYSLLADTTWSFSSAISMTSTNLLSSAIMKGLKYQNCHTTHTTKVTSILPD